MIFLSSNDPLLQLRLQFNPKFWQPQREQVHVYVCDAVKTPRGNRGPQSTCPQLGSQNRKALCRHRAAVRNLGEHRRHWEEAEVSQVMLSVPKTLAVKLHCLHCSNPRCYPVHPPSSAHFPTYLACILNTASPRKKQILPRKQRCLYVYTWTPCK